MDADFLGTGYKFPFSLKQGKMQLSEGGDSIRESINMILGTNPGERVMRPDFGCGIHRYVFGQNNTGTANQIEAEVRQALTRYEPRIDLDSVVVYPDEEDSSRLNINISYTIKYYNAKENMVYPFYLEKG